MRFNSWTYLMDRVTNVIGVFLAWLAALAPVRGAVGHGHQHDHDDPDQDKDGEHDVHGDKGQVSRVGLHHLELRWALWSFLSGHHFSLFLLPLSISQTHSTHRLFVWILGDWKYFLRFDWQTDKPIFGHADGQTDRHKETQGRAR